MACKEGSEVPTHRGGSFLNGEGPSSLEGPFQGGHSPNPLFMS